MNKCILKTTEENMKVMMRILSVLDLRGDITLNEEDKKALTLALNNSEVEVYSNGN